MRTPIPLLVAVTTVLTVLSPASAGLASSAAGHSGSADLAVVERWLYATSLPAFVRAASSPPDRWFDWSTDHCSAPLVGNTGLSFDFTDACRRHDFGYRNLQLLERRYGTGATYWNAASRQRVDRQLLSDARAHCATRAITLRTQCRAWATTFYLAVRVAGGP
jgi:hypothetical protein